MTDYDEPTRREELLLGGIAAARAVVSAWCGGDLASAVNALEAWADEAEAELEP